MLKHGRFMPNLMVCPVFPKVIEPAADDDLDENANEEDNE
jgi:hypothetical protein